MSAVGTGDRGWPAPARRIRRWLLPAGLVVALVAGIGAVAASHRWERVTVRSDSMSPTIAQGATVWVDEGASSESIVRGHIVVFRDPGGWVDAADDGAGQPAPVVERVIGVGGDRVVCCTADGRLTVDAVPLDEPHLAAGTAPRQRSARCV